jgi:hypothetical protein
MATLKLVQGDTKPSVAATLRHSDSVTPIDLSGCTVRFQMRRQDDLRYTVNGLCVIVNARAGTVRYDWAVNDLTSPGDYYIQFEVEYIDHSVQTTASPIPVNVRRQ